MAKIEINKNDKEEILNVAISQIKTIMKERKVSFKDAMEEWEKTTEGAINDAVYSESGNMYDEF